MASRLVADLPWHVARERLQSGAPAVLPIGAGSKAHGLHLPLGTDYIQAEHFAAYTAEAANGLIWPAITYGHYPAFTAYAGSASLTMPTFIAMLGEILGALCLNVPGRIIIIDTGISTIAPVDAAAATCPAPERVSHVAIYRGRLFLETVDRLQQQVDGGHADEIETSVMLAIAPVKVSMDEARPSGVGALAAGKLNPTDPTAPNYAPTGGTGDPTLATRAKGEQLVAAIKADIDAALAQGARRR